MNATTKAHTRADVLVIDDDEVMRDLVADWLRVAGYAVRKVADGRAGLAEVKRAEPALVVTDMRMPGPGGFEIIRTLRQDYPTIPIIAISAHFCLSDRSAGDALTLGAARALAKPVKRGEIMRAVADLVGPPVDAA